MAPIIMKAYSLKKNFYKECTEDYEVQFLIAHHCGSHRSQIVCDTIVIFEIEMDNNIYFGDVIVSI